MIYGKIVNNGTLTGHLKNASGDVPPYEGEYEVTPTRETQILNTEGLRMTGDVIINPIPQNYGLIEWNGSVLRVS